MKKPILKLPSKPKQPPAPPKTFTISESVDYIDGKISLQELQDKYSKYDPNRVFILLESDISGCPTCSSSDASLKVEVVKEIEYPAYQTELRRYEKSLAKYHERLAEWEAKAETLRKQHEKDLKAYKEHLSEKKKVTKKFSKEIEELRKAGVNVEIK